MNQQTTNRDTGEAAATNAPANSATSTSTPDNQPTPLDAFEVLLITGMSGAGRSHAADCVEDMGWYVVDNLPPKLLIPLVDMMTTSGFRIGVRRPQACRRHRRALQLFRRAGRRARPSG